MRFRLCKSSNRSGMNWGDEIPDEPYLRAAESHRYIGKVPYAIEVPQAYHRWLDKKRELAFERFNYIGKAYHNHVAISDMVNDHSSPGEHVWDGDINNLVDEENFVYEIKEILYRPDEIVGLRVLTKAEMLEYARGYSETLIAFRKKSSGYRQPDPWSKFTKIFRPKISHKICNNKKELNYA